MMAVRKYKKPLKNCLNCRRLKTGYDYSENKMSPYCKVHVHFVNECDQKIEEIKKTKKEG